MQHSIHHIPGRLRIRSTQLRCQPKKGDTLLKQLRQLDGIEHIRFNRAAGSVVIHYDSVRVDQQQILEQLKTSGCVPLPTAGAAIVTKAGAFFGKALVGAVVNKVVNKAVEQSALRLVSVLL